MFGGWVWWWLAAWVVVLLFNGNAWVGDCVLGYGGCWIWWFDLLLVVSWVLMIIASGFDVGDVRCFGVV